jgi:hypothetical protein
MRFDFISGIELDFGRDFFGKLFNTHAEDEGRQGLSF